MKLYELAQAYEDLQSLLLDDEQDVELIQNTLESIQDAFEVKAENTAKVIKSIEAEQEALVAESKRLAERASKMQNKVDSMKEYLLFNMIQTGNEKIQGRFFTLSTRKSTSVQVDSIEVIPQEFVVEKTTFSPDKRLIGDALKSGQVVPGCQLIERKSIQIK